MDEKKLSMEAERIIRPLIPKDSEERVKRSFRQWNQIVREHIRTETGLKLSEGESRFSIPVRVIEGFPDALARLITESNDPILWRLIVGLPKLGYAIEGLQYLKESWQELMQWPLLPDAASQGGPSITANLNIVRELQRLINQEKIVKQFLSLREDILGSYHYNFLARISLVELYWMPIAMVAGMLDVKIEDLTVVVLIHELTHGYTHIGRDIDGNVWDDHGYSDSEKAVIEGLAQYYTNAITDHMSTRAPGAKEAFERGLALQGAAYHSHEEWLTDAPSQRGEIIRFALLAARNMGKVKYSEWKSLLKTAQEDLKLHSRGRS